jgi:hypothetical protein
MHSIEKKYFERNPTPVHLSREREREREIPRDWLRFMVFHETFNNISVI